MYGMKTKMLALSLGVAAAVVAPASANGERIYYRGSEAVAAQAGGASVVAAPAAVVPAPVQYQPPATVRPALPAVALPAPPAGPPGCVNCTPGSAQARNYGAGTPNAIVTFLHPYTNKAVSVPMTLPVGKPAITTRSDRIIYDYSKFGPFGRYIVVRFFPDGTVMTRYH
jgi:hypothetical protein